MDQKGLRELSEVLVVFRISRGMFYTDAYIFLNQEMYTEFHCIFTSRDWIKTRGGKKREPKQLSGGNWNGTESVVGWSRQLSPGTKQIQIIFWWILHYLNSIYWHLGIQITVSFSIQTHYLG